MSPSTGGSVLIASGCSVETTKGSLFNTRRQPPAAKQPSSFRGPPIGCNFQRGCSGAARLRFL